MVTSGVDSKTILDQTGAENLLGRGDMLYLPGGQNKPSRVQGAFMDDDEVALLVSQIKTNFGEAQYEDIVSQYMEEEEEAADDSGFYDDRFNAALDVIAREKYVSTSMLQRHLGIGYNRAARIVDVLYARGICGASESGKKRKLTIPLEEIPDHYILMSKLDTTIRLIYGRNPIREALVSETVGVEIYLCCQGSGQDWTTVTYFSSSERCQDS